MQQAAHQVGEKAQFYGLINRPMSTVGFRELLLGVTGAAWAHHFLLASWRCDALLLRSVHVLAGSILQ
jgi:hypothetical protein